MKISVNWVKELGVSLPDDKKELVAKISSGLGAIESTVDLKEKYSGAYIVKVVQCDKHPNADKLSVCLIDDGGAVQHVNRNDRGYIQVVCGAPNIAEGQLVVWLSPGSIVPATHQKDEFRLDVRDIRGKTSAGMIASEKELDLGADHSGILVISDDVHIGSTFASAFGLDDFIIEIENKMITNRPDCFGVLGLARELSGIFGQKFQSPAWYLSDNYGLEPEAELLDFSVENEVPELAPRFTMVALSHVGVGTSPLWLRSYLMRMGQKPINNVVDITNYLMFLTGQPLHAFDYDKVTSLSDNSKAKVIVRHPRQDEELKLLDGKVIKPHESSILICTNQTPIALAGVMGGKETEVDENTKRILLETANFNLYSVRKTSMKHGIFTEAVTRFSKGQNSRQCGSVARQALELLKKETGAKIASQLVDIDKDENNQSNTIDTDTGLISSRLGHEFSSEAIGTLLSNVEFQVQTNSNLSIAIPFWRKDILIAEDIVEEVGRLYGYDKLTLELPRRSLKPAKGNPSHDFEKDLKIKLASAGANEVYSYNFIHEDLLNCASQSKDSAYHIRNAISPELQYMRVSLLPGLLSKVHANIKRNYATIALFETGVVHVKSVNDDNDSGLPKELSRLAFVFAVGDLLAEKYSGAPYYRAKKYLDFITDGLGLNVTYRELRSNYEYTPSKLAIAPLDSNRSAEILINGVCVGFIGEFNAVISKKLKLPSICAGFEIGLQAFQKLLPPGRKSIYRQISKFPVSRQDISFAVNSSVTYDDLRLSLMELLDEESLSVSIEPLDIYRKDETTKHISFRLVFSSSKKTFTTEETNTLLEEASKGISDKFKAVRL